ncbi:MAG: tetratricopeptide repeat protein [Lachnospira sp.]
MRCYKCGCHLTANNVCPKCGCDVSVYKRTASVSNVYYNAGLEKARIRDLTGAIESLKISIMINKYNISARNLLGLVYYEMGEVAEALGQWVLSKNFAPEDKVADYYIKKVQSNQNKFEMMAGQIKKYNLSLKYAQEGSTDLAVIQLKKIIVQSPKYIRAQLLLSLLYINEKEYVRAKKLLNEVLKNDHNNTLAHRYLREINLTLQARKKDAQAQFLPEKQTRKVETAPLNGNDVIVPRSSYKEPSHGAVTIIYVLIGVVIGAALIWFLITPARYKGLTAEYNRTLAEYSEQLSSGNVELNELERKVKEIQTEKEALEEQLSRVSSTDGTNKHLVLLIDAANSYLDDKKTECAQYLLEIDVTALPSDNSKTLYNTLSEDVMSDAAGYFYDSGMTEYGKSDYEKAADYFVKSYQCKKDDANAPYYAAKCYVALKNTDEAKKYYQYIVADFADSTYFAEAKEYVDTH